MAMIKCPECGKDISSHAKACNNCGFPLEYKKFLRFEVMLSNKENIFGIDIFAYDNSIKIAAASITDIYSKTVEENIYSKELARPDITKELKAVLTRSHNEHPRMLAGELTFYGRINRLEFVFVEHLVKKVCNIECGKQNDEYIGLHFTENQVWNDRPTTYAGGDNMCTRAFGLETYMHPDFSFRNTEYDKIVPNCFPKINYK